MNKKHFIKTCFFMMIIFFCMLNLSEQAASAAQSADKPTIKVGYYLTDTYQEIQEDGSFSGYGYDFYAEIAQHTGWSYEFVVASFGDCLHMLETGEIDIMGGLSKTEDRLETLDFSETSTQETQAELYALSTNTSLGYEDYAHFQNMRVGMLYANQQERLLRQYCTEHNFSINISYFHSTTALTQALENGEIDTIFISNLADFADKKVVARFPSVYLYYAFPKNSPLVSQLNAALETIQNTYPNFKMDLFYKYASNDHCLYPDFTNAELEYIQNHPTFVVTYDPVWRPIEYTDKTTGEYHGITADLFHQISLYSGLSFDYVSGNTYADTLQLLAEGKADILSAMSRDYNQAANNNLLLTSPFLKSSVVMLANRNLTGNIQSIAVPRNYYTTSQLEKLYEPSQLVYFDTIEECMQAVNSNHADVTFANSYVANYYLNHLEYRSLHEFQLTSLAENLSIAISADADPLLLSILNKTLQCISTQELEQIILENTMFIDEHLTWSSFLFSYFKEISMVFIFIIIAITVIFFGIIHSKTKTSRILKQSAEIDALTGLYNRATAEKEIVRVIHDSLQHTQNFALISLDLDKFKKVNDTYGHISGDNLLTAVAATLKKKAPTDAIVGRMGGDEFIVCIPNVPDADYSMQAAEQLRHAILGLAKASSQWHFISASIGVLTIAPNNETSFDEVYRLVDDALYSAKEKGRNQCCSL